MKYALSFLAAVLLIAGCGPDEPQRIVDASIEAHGGSRFERSVISFDFRDWSYAVRREGGLFSYERTTRDGDQNVREVLNNDELYREVNGRQVTLTPAEVRSLETAVNSVVYFALLPFRLNDPAVQKRLLGEQEVAGRPYDLVEITFQQEGGGRDWDDRFVYWFDQETRTMDYLAYSFGDEGGTRFRQAVNPRVVGGIRFLDYLNFTSEEIQQETLEGYTRLFEAGTLSLLSEINLENVRVSAL